MVYLNVKGLTKILLIVGLSGVLFGSCASLRNLFKPKEEKTEENIADNVFVYSYNKKIVRIPGPFTTKDEGDYTSFTEIPKEDEKLDKKSGKKLKPTLYQMNASKTVYLDCQEDGFNGNEYPLNLGFRGRIIELGRTHNVEEICKRLGYKNYLFN